MASYEEEERRLLTELERVRRARLVDGKAKFDAQYAQLQQLVQEYNAQIDPALERRRSQREEMFQTFFKEKNDFLLQKQKEIADLKKKIELLEMEIQLGIASRYLGRAADIRYEMGSEGMNQTSISQAKLRIAALHNVLKQEFGHLYKEDQPISMESIRAQAYIDVSKVLEKSHFIFFEGRETLESQIKALIDTINKNPDRNLNYCSNCREKGIIKTPYFGGSFALQKIEIELSNPDSGHYYDGSQGGTYTCSRKH